mmetsp:Transcript_21274/g.67957  ORF Transcript_21274/g.67957 Transcript_21274/m.67957 type:complete len:397 (+) Transcript_21274:120-1310(+)
MRQPVYATALASFVEPRQRSRAARRRALDSPSLCSWALEDLRHFGRIHLEAVVQLLVEAVALAVPPLDELVLRDAARLRAVHQLEGRGQLRGVREGEAETRGGLTDLAHVEVAGAVGVKLLEKRREVLEGSRAELRTRLVRDRPAELIHVRGGLSDLPLLLSRGPAELLGHDVGHAWHSLLGRLRVDVREPHPQREHVLDATAVLATAVLHLLLDEGVAFDEEPPVPRPALLRRLGEGAHIHRAPAVGADEMLGHVRAQPKLLDELDGEEVLGLRAEPTVAWFEVLRADEREMARDARTNIFEALLLDDAVDGVLCHLAVRGPLAARDEADPRLWVVREQMVARDGRSGWRVRVGGQRPPAAPRREHVGAADLELGREVAPNLVEQVLDLVLVHRR